MGHRRWSEAEDAILREFYPRGGFRAVASRLSRRCSAEAISARAERLGVKGTRSARRGVSAPRQSDPIDPAFIERLRAINERSARKRGIKF